MISALVNGTLATEGFEREFLRTFKQESAGMDDELFRILDRLFGAVDAYWSECQSDQETLFSISEQSLRREAAAALKQLDQFIRQDRIGRATG